jgi:hypothetical protein
LFEILHFLSCKKPKRFGSAAQVRPFAARRTNEQVGLAPIHKLAPLPRSEAIAVFNQNIGSVYIHSRRETWVLGFEKA